MNNRNILNIYKKYRILPNLQDHMLRVAAVASTICDAWNGEVLPNKEKIITAALLHDMGNIIKIRLNHFPELISEEGLDYWEDVKNDYIKKYGTDEHKATLEILRELYLGDEISHLINSVGHMHFCDQLLNKDIDAIILNYADTRVGPFGVLSYRQRMQEVSSRYKNYDNYIGDEKHEKAVSCGEEIETWIFQNCRITREEITDESTKEILENLKSFVLK